MQDYLPMIKTILLDWLELTLANPLYAASLAIAVYLLAAIVYGIRIVILKRKHHASELARAELLNNLNSAQQRETGLKEQLVQRNQQIAGTIQSLAASFDLGEHPLPASEESNPDALWKQHERAVATLAKLLRSEQQAKAELLQSYQAETAKRVEKEALAESLQTAMAEQTALISRQEEALQEQKSKLIEEQEKLQQTLTQIVEKHLTVMSRLAELEKQAEDRVNNKPQSTSLEEKMDAEEVQMPPLHAEIPVARSNPLAHAEGLPPDLNATLHAAAIQTTPLHEDIPVTQSRNMASAVGSQAGLNAMLHAEAVQAIQSHEDIPVVTASAQTPTEARESDEAAPRTIILPDWDMDEESPAQSEPKQAAPDAAPASGVAGKMKSLFGKSRSAPLSTERKVAEIKPLRVETQSEPAFDGARPEGSAQNRLGKIRNLFSMAK